MESVLIKKLLIGILILTTLNGCVQSSAFLGPAVTGASTGNVYQAGLSYSTNLVVKEITGKTPIENFQELLTQKKDDNRIISSVKKNFEKHTKKYVASNKNSNETLKLFNKIEEQNSLDFYTLVENLYIQDQSNQ
jgi:outer membrane lipoprotein-sorting protein